MYFRNPHTICDSNESLRKEKSTFGHELYIQTKSWLDAGGKKAIRIPKKPNQLKHTLWMEGKCFPKMGKKFSIRKQVNAKLRAYTSQIAWNWTLQGKSLRWHLLELLRFDVYLQQV